jgi:hypothetical protein
MKLTNRVPRFGANITVAEVNETIATVIAAQALGALKANTVMARLVRRDWDSEVATHGQTIQIPYGGALTVNPKAANAAVTLQTPGDSVYTLTLNHHEEVSFLIEDMAKALARPDWLSTYMADGIKAIAEKIDADLTALYAGLTQTIDATAGLAETHLRTARRLLNAAKAPLSDRFLVLHEDAEYEALGIEKLVNRDYAEALGALAADAYVGRTHGFATFMDQKITVAGGQCKNIAFHRDAFCMATRTLPLAPAGTGVIQKVMDEDGIGLRVTLSYSPDYLGVQCTIDVLYGVAELKDSHGVAISTDEI